MEFNRILIPPRAERAFYKIERVGEVQPDGNRSRKFANDPSSVRFLVEEMISCGAVEIHFPAGSPFQRYVADLPVGIRDRVVVADSDGSTLKQARAILRPVTGELDLNVDKWIPTQVFANEFQHAALRSESADVRNQAMAMATFADTVYLLLLGIRNKLQVDFSVHDTVRAISLLRKAVRSPEATRNLALVRGMLSTYRPTSYATVQIASGLTIRELADHFSAFAEDECYRQLSAHLHALGYSDKLRRSVVMARRWSGRLIRKAPFKQILNLTSKAVETATSVPVPDSEMAVELLSEAYLPPAVSTVEAVLNARQLWASDDKDWEPMNVALYTEPPLSSEGGV